ncbi:non-canonical purine NTP pyrophosphatase [Enterococcus rivorum]|uniref:non-canonical purine NTP pyrophosphatase n=1 Tax=Enterococcus rivorum TaxID=762845 RepID=UPI00362A18A8
MTGDLGYGFDSIFYLPELGCTLAQLSKATRDTYSPRVIALKKMIEKIKEENCDENESLFLGE